MSIPIAQFPILLVLSPTGEIWKKKAIWKEIYMEFNFITLDLPIY